MHSVQQSTTRYMKMHAIGTVYVAQNGSPEF
jgi:hypothetical protein